ncbi:ASCH domain-containing protein [Kineococcus sp. SYSU DK004]|uniref:ASCH domain-containing protein n=1 Tax=Kineococcus sp. SYSU DK004 TaxID=3383125 RepID=UPI003D7C987D
MTWTRVDGLRTLELGTPGRVRRELTALVLAGRKRATAGLLDVDYAAEGEEVERVGERLAVLDDGGAHVATVEVTAVRVVPFAEVDDAFAREEGEGYAGHADWAAAHERYWAGVGVAVSAGTPVVCLRFRLVGADG